MDMHQRWTNPAAEFARVQPTLAAFLIACLVAFVASSAIADVKNISPFGTASQSSTAFGGVASRANDGNTNGQFFNGSVTHTTENNTDLTPFWELSFPADFNFESVTLWNRTDCCGNRLSDLTISIFNDATEVYNSFTDLGDYINPGNILGSPETIDLDLLGTVGAKTGDRLRVQRDGQPLSLAEVQVFADTNLEPFPILEIIRQTGQASLRNNTFFSVDIAGYSIRSSGGHLLPAGWLSIAENYDSNDGGLIDADDQWLEFTDALSTADISEGTLGTTTMVREAAPINLGTIWTPNPTEDDITAQFLLADGVTTQPIQVEFIDLPMVSGDYNQNGIVDAADYTVWRDNLGSATSLPNDDSPGVGQDDYIRWKNNFGNTSGAGANVASVPEPASAWLVILAGAAAALSYRSRNKRRTCTAEASMNLQRTMLPSLAMAVVCAFVAATANAAFTIDRDYKLGDNADEHAAAGIAVGAGAGNVNPGFTLDSTGTSAAGDRQDMQAVGTPTYANVAGRPMGGSGLGAHFESGEYLVGTGLGFPSGNMPNPNADYTGIFERGIMGWVKPDATGLAAGLRQDIVVDTAQFQVFLDEQGKFSMRHGVINLATPEREVHSDLTAQADTWYHFQLHSYGTQPGVLYINGLAVAMVNSFYGGGTSGQDLVIGASLELADRFFSGTVDDVVLYVAGENDSMVDFGTFDILQDNPFMAQALNGYVQGDLNGDGLVQGDGSGSLGAADDVKSFIDNWLFEKLIPASDLDNESILLSTGDMETRLKGDFNLDGATDLLDWGILRSLHPDGDNLNLSALLAGKNVPEPSTLVAFCLAAASLLACRRKR